MPTTHSIARRTAGSKSVMAPSVWPSAPSMAKRIPELESETFATSTTFDALNRPTRLTSADTSAIVPVYNEANLLDSVTVFIRGAASGTLFVGNIDYDAKGQRLQVAYGNGVRSAYS